MNRRGLRARLGRVFAAQAAVIGLAFMACEEVFGFAGGTGWQVGHYLLAPERAGAGGAR